MNFCQNEEAVVIVDAGGGTIDVSTYALKTTSGDEYAEVTPAQCEISPFLLCAMLIFNLFRIGYFMGSVFVTRAAARHLTGTFLIKHVLTILKLLPRTF